VGVAAGQIAIGLISVTLDMLVANTVMKYPLSDLFKSISPSLASTLSMAAVLFLIQQFLPNADLVQLILMVALGGLTYFVVFWLINPETLLQGVNTIRSTLHREKPAMGGAVND
jgi:hypothetical protein